MIVIYPYRATRGDVELKFSLRSLAFVEHSRVIVAGDRPHVTSNLVEHVPVLRYASRYASSTQNIFAAASRADAERVMVMNDDMFLLKPWTFQHENRGTIEDYLANGRPAGDYRRHIEATRSILKAHGVDDPLFFGLHTPTVYDRKKLLDVIREFKGKRFLLRTLYHNLFPQPSVTRTDVKIRQWTGENLPDDVLSTSDECTKSAGFIEWMTERFPLPSRYEKAMQRNLAA